MIAYIIQPCGRHPVAQVRDGPGHKPGEAPGAPRRSAASSRASSAPCTTTATTPTANSDQPFSRGPQPKLERRVEHPARVEHRAAPARPARRPRRARRRRGAASAPAAPPSGFGPRERELRAPVRRQRFGTARTSRTAVQQRERGGDVERQSQVDRAEQAARHRPEDEAEPERRAEHAEAPWRGCSGGVTSATYALATEKFAPRRAPEDPRRQHQSGSVGAIASRKKCAPSPQQRPEQQRAPAEAVGERAQHRRAENWHEVRRR